jgi:hypothetical protein
MSSQDFGIKVSQSGYSAFNAPDYALAFSSSWPQLPIAAEFIQMIAPFNGGGAPYTYNPITFTHTLGYPAFARVWVSGTGTGLATGHVTGDVYNLTTSKNSVTYSSPATTNNLSDRITVFVRVYALDITTPVSYPYKQPPVINTPYDPDFGIKIVKEGKDIMSKDMRDFILHSRCQSPQVDSVLVGASGATLTYTNTTGYTNWVFGFGSFNSGVSFVPARTDQPQSPPGLFITNNVYSIGASGMVPVIVVLRDPLFAAAQVEVTY